MVCGARARSGNSRLHCDDWSRDAVERQHDVVDGQRYQRHAGNGNEHLAVAQRYHRHDGVRDRKYDRGVVDDGKRDARNRDDRVSTA